MRMMMRQIEKAFIFTFVFGRVSATCKSNTPGLPFQLEPADYPFLVATYDNTTRKLFAVVEPETDGIISVLVGENDEKSFDGIFELDLSEQQNNRIDFSFAIPPDVEELRVSPLNGQIQFNFRARVPRDVGDGGGGDENTYQVIELKDFCSKPKLTGSMIKNMAINATKSFVSITPNVIFTRVIFNAPSNEEFLIRNLTYSIEYDPTYVKSGIQEYWYSTEDYMEVLATFPESSETRRYLK